MSDINYDKFKESLARLEERYKDYIKHSDLDGFLKESVRESCIQRFEVCFDTSWKHIRKYLIEEMGLVDIQNSPNPIFRQAEASKIIVQAEKWIDFNKNRGDTTHDYSGDKAENAFKIISDFIKEAIDVYEIISGKKWQSKK